MASLTGNLVAETYKALLKTIDNDILTASEKQITDGLGGGSNVFIDSNGFLRANKYKVTNGLATQFLKADGSLDANTYLTSITGAQVITALGYTPVTDQRTLTINGVTYNLTANRSWTVAGTAAVWGNITGTLSNQTDLQAALNAKFNVPAGTISQYIRGDGTLATFPTLPGGLPIGGTAGQILSKIDATDYNTHWIDNFATQTKNEVKLGQTLAKGAAVYVSSADGTNIIVSAASNASEALSSKTFGLLETGGSTNAFVKCVTFGLLAGLNTSAAQAGDPVWLGVNGALLFGLANKPVAPANMVYIGVVTRVQSNNGEIFVNVQNGFEIEELHDVLIQSKANNQGLFYESSTGLWKNKSIATVLGYTPQAQLDGTGFVKASGTTISYDNSTYLTTADAASTYQLLTNLSTDLTASATKYPSVNAVIAGLATKQPLDADLTAIAALAGTSGFLIKTAADTWSLDTNTYLTTATAASTYQRLDKMVSNLLASDTEYPNSNAVIAALALKANAANPVFTGNMTISGAEPKLTFTDTDQNPDYFIGVDAGFFRIFDQTAGATRFVINSDGNISAGVGKSITAGSFVKESGTAAQFLKADGSIDSSTYVTSASLANYLLITTAASTYQRLDKMVSNLLASDTEYPNSNAVLAKLALKADAANPVFTGDLSISGATPRLYFVDTDQNPDYTVFIDSGFFYIYDQTAGATRFSINSSGNISTGVGKSITAGSFVRDGGTASQYLMADGSVSTGPNLSAYLPLAGGTMTGVITTPNSTFGIIIGDDSRLADRNIANTLFLEGVQNNDRGYINFSETTGNALGAINGGALTWRGVAITTTANISGTTNYIPKFTSANVIGNSAITDDGTTVSLISRGLSGSGATFTGNVQSARFYNTFLNATNNSRNSFQSFNLNEVTITAGWIAADFGDLGTTSDRVVIGSGYTNKAIIGGHNGILGAWASLYVNPGGGNLIVGASTDAGYKFDVNGSGRFTTNVNIGNYLSLGTGSGKFLAVGGDISGAFSASDFVLWNTGGDLYLYGTGAAGIIVKATSGNVAIGTTNAASRFNIRGDSSNSQIEFNNFSTGQNYILSYDRVSNAYRDLIITTNASNNAFVVTTSGNVAIGAISASARLGVYKSQAGASSAQSGVLRLENTGLNYTSTIVITDGTTNDALISYLGPTQSLGFGIGATATQMILRPNGNLLIGTQTDAGYKLYVNGEIAWSTGTFNAILGSVSSSWSGSTIFPTLYGSTADRWVMHINPHISYTQNGVNGYSGSMNGATIRMAGNPAAVMFWDIGVGVCSVGNDVFAIGRNNSALLSLNNTGNLTATAFFESSDIRLKTLIENNPIINGIEKLEAKLYEKNGKIELGYFAQDAESIMPHAIQIGTDGFLSLSYREIHTAKIARLEKEVAELKEKLNLN